MRGHASCAPKHAHHMEGAKPGLGGQRRQRHALGVVRLDIGARPRHRARLGPGSRQRQAVAAVALNERGEQRQPAAFALDRGGFRADCPLHGAHLRRQPGVVDPQRREARQPAGPAKLGHRLRHVVEGGVERAVGEAGRDGRLAGVRVARVEQDEPARRRGVGGVAAPERLRAGFDQPDHIIIVPVARKGVGLELRLQNIQAQVGVVAQGAPLGGAGHRRITSAGRFQLRRAAWRLPLAPGWFPAW